jgi:phosphoglycolate phosphatase-like HAD superfamily hydrolase
MIARSLFVESKKLRVFDFDDTLVKTDSYIYITKQNGYKLKLTPGQYAKYKPTTGDKFDFSDFQAVTNPTIIKGYFKVLQNMAAKGTVYILTARASYKPIYNFIKDSGVKNVYVVALADGNPEKKADWIEDKVRNEKYDDVFFIDDSDKNIAAVRKRLRPYKNVKQKLQIAKPDSI